MTRNWFFWSLPVGAISILMAGNFWGGLLLVILTLARVATLRVAIGWWVTGALCLGTAGWLGWQQDQLAHQRAPITASTTLATTFRVQPDSLVMTGGGYRMIGEAPTGERLLVRGVVHSREELQQLQALRRPTRWLVSGQRQGLLAAPNFRQFDAAAYWGRRGIANSFKIQQLRSLSPVKSSFKRGWADWWHSRRAAVIRHCERLPGALRVYALGLFVGNRAEEASQELVGMQRLGLIHLLAISGLHVALLLTALEWVAVHLHLPREWWEWGLLLCLPGYVLLAGGGSGVLRACWMRGALLGAKQCGRRLDPLAAWSLALVIGIWGNPGLLLELGSQLSYGLSLALIFLSQEATGWRQLGLTLLSLPSLLTSLFQWHGLTLLANWLIVPLFTTVMLPVTIIGTLSAAWSPALMHLCTGVLSTIDTGLRWGATLPGNVMYGQPPWWIAWGWWGVTWWLFSRPPHQRRRLLMGLLVSYGLVFVGIHFPLSGEVTYFDVGQGDSILIRDPFNRRVRLIDVGGRLSVPQPRWAPQRPSTYAAAHTVIPYLQSHGITRINEVYLTHHDADHIGDLPAILASFQVDRLLVPAGMETEPAWQHLLTGHTDVPVIPLKVGTAASLRVWHPFTPGVADNGGSLALSGRFGGQHFMFMGDLDQVGEHQILATGQAPKVDVLKIGHHGSHTATAPDFLRQVAPQLAIISAGRQNRYGHPDAITLQTLSEQHVRTWTTQTAGMIRYRYRGSHGEWATKLHIKERSPV